MKLLVLAHTPPPPHGQSMMVKLMVDGFGGDCRGARPAAPDGNTATLAEGRRFGITVYHVNARLSSSLADVGRVRPAKALRLAGYCAQALWVRFRHDVKALYYVPSPPKRSALYRDWLVMACCRPFFRTMTLHWHAVGLGEWLEHHASRPERWITRALLGRADLAIILSRLHQADVEKMKPRRMAVVANGLADPCPDYGLTMAPRRLARAAARRRLLAGQTLNEEEGRQAGEHPEVVQVLFLAHCTRDKGLFDAVEGVRLANEQLAARGLSVGLRLTVVGAFLRAEEQTEFERLLARPGTSSWLRHLGFIGEPDRKWAVIREADVFCFPTYYANEAQPINLIEAAAFGLPLVTTRWRSIPEFMPLGHPGLVNPRQPAEVAAALVAVLGDDGVAFRDLYEKQFSLARHLEALAAALRRTDPAL